MFTSKSLGQRSVSYVLLLYFYQSNHLYGGYRDASQVESNKLVINCCVYVYIFPIHGLYSAFLTEPFLSKLLGISAVTTRLNFDLDLASRESVHAAIMTCCWRLFRLYVISRPNHAVVKVEKQDRIGATAGTVASSPAEAAAAWRQHGDSCCSSGQQKYIAGLLATAAAVT